MKKWVGVLLALLTACAAYGAFAEGTISIRQQKYMAVEEFADHFYGYLFAQLENTGDSDVYFDRGDFQIRDAQGNVIQKKTVYTCYPNVIAPGETAYLFTFGEIEDAESVADLPGYALTVTGSEPVGEAGTQLTVVSARLAQEKDLFGERVYRVYVTARNDTEDTLFTPSVAFGLFDQEEKLLYGDAVTLFSLGVPPEQTFVASFSIDEAFVAAWEAEGAQPAQVQAVAVVQYAF